MTKTQLNRRDWAISAGLALLALTVFELTFQPLMFGDGPQLLQTWLHHEDKVWMHALYMPFVRLLGWLVPGPASMTELQLASTLPAAIAVGGSFLLARTFGGSRFPAIIGALLLGAAPATIFFATTIEVHALHAGCVVVVALVTILAPWNRAGLALSIVAATFPLIYLSHKSGVLLGPGWLALVAHGRLRHGMEDSWRFLLLVAGPVLAGSMMASLLAGNLIVNGTLGTGIGQTTGFIQRFQLGWSPTHLLTHWLLPTGVSLVMVAMVALRSRTSITFPLLALILPSLVFFQWYGEENQGGYLLGSLPFVAATAGGLYYPPRIPRRVLLLGLILVVGQATLGVIAAMENRDPDRLRWLTDRAALVRETVGERGILVSADPHLQPVTLLLPDVEEVTLTSDLWGAHHAKLPVETFAATIPVLIQRVVARSKGKPLALALSYENTDAGPTFAPYMTKLEAIVRKNFEVEEHKRGKHRLLLMK